MRINNIDNAQNFGAIYKVRATMNNIKQFDEAAAPLYRSLKKKGIRAFVKNVSEMYTMTGKDAYEFDRKYAQLVRNKENSKIIQKAEKLKDNVIALPLEAHNFIREFLRDKKVEPINGFKNLLIKIFS